MEGPPLRRSFQYTQSPEGERMDDAARLAAYDAFAAQVRTELAEVSERMGALHDESKVKTATYRQLFASRITLKEIDARLSERGL